MFYLTDKMFAILTRAHAALRRGLGSEEELICERTVDDPLDFARWLLGGRDFERGNEFEQDVLMPEWATRGANDVVTVEKISTKLVEFDEKKWSQFTRLLDSALRHIKHKPNDRITYMLSPSKTGDGDDLLIVKLCSDRAPKSQKAAKDALAKLPDYLQAILGDVRVSFRFGITGVLQSGIAKPGRMAGTSDGAVFTQTVLIRAKSGDGSVPGSVLSNGEIYTVVPGHGMYDSGLREFHNTAYEPPGDIDARSVLGQVSSSLRSELIEFDFRSSVLKNKDAIAVPLSISSPNQSIVPVGWEAPIGGAATPDDQWENREVLIFTGQNGVKKGRIVAVRDEVQLPDVSGRLHDYKDVCVIQDMTASNSTGIPRRLTANGDSGSPVCFDRGTSLELVGYIIGGSMQRGSAGRLPESYFLPIDLVLESLEAEVIT